MAKNWTVEELEYLEDNWGVISVKSISNYLNRSVNAINIKKDRLGLGAFLDNGDYITWNQLLNVLGVYSVGYKSVSWIKSKGFPIRYKSVNKKRYKVVNIEDFWKWADKNRGLIDFSLLEENTLGIEPEWIKLQRKIGYKTKTLYKTTDWTDSEDRHLLNLLREFKYTYIDLSRKLQRTNGSIQRRICDLGYKERPVKADNLIKWTKEEFNTLDELIKQGYSYQIMEEILGKSQKAIRGRVYSLYQSENLDKVRGLVNKQKVV